MSLKAMIHTIRHEKQGGVHGIKLIRGYYCRIRVTKLFSSTSEGTRGGVRQILVAFSIIDWFASH